jgi:outer membrane protein TolC
MKNIYEVLRQKEAEIAQKEAEIKKARGDIEVLRAAIRLLNESSESTDFVPSSGPSAAKLSPTPVASVVSPPDILRQSTGLVAKGRAEENSLKQFP